VSVFLAVGWLLLAGPIAGVLLARASGTLTGPRAALWAAGCQLVLAALYLLTQSVPVRSYGGPLNRPGVLVAKARFVVVLVLLAAAIAALAAAAWRHSARR
jgi:hypothetical protein